MQEATRAENREGSVGIEAAPVSIAGLGAAAFTSAASAAPISIITTTKRATDTYLPAPAILSRSPKNPAPATRY